MISFKSLPSKSLPTLSIVLSIIALIGVVGVNSQNSAPGIVPQDFDPSDVRDRPELTNIDFDIKGLAQVGEIFMIEGISNETSIQVERNTFSAGPTSYAPLILHGVFHRQMRDWRRDVIAGSVQKRDIEMDIYNTRGQRVLRINFKNAFPISFTLPPFSVDNETRYMERIEMIYDTFEIVN